MKIKLLLLTLVSFVKIGFAQNTVSYSSLNNTLNLNSGVEGTSEVVVSCYGNSDSPVVLNTFFLCGDPDGYISYLASSGHSLLPGKQTTLKFRFKKTVTTDTQKVYKFSTNGSCTQDESKMIKITVNYKAQPVLPTPSPGPIAGYIMIPNILGSNSYHTYEGQYANINIVGDYIASNYEWQKKKFDGSTWETIPLEINRSLNVVNISESTYFRRIAKNEFGAFIGYSNEINIEVEKVIGNNLINLSGIEVVGSFPSGLISGQAIPRQRWLVYAVEGEDPWTFGEDFNNPNVFDFTIPKSVYDFMASTNNNVYIRREIYTYTQSILSNTVTVTPAQDITNNFINLSGNNVLGNLPNGGVGTFKYEYKAYNTIDDEIIGEVYTVGTDLNYQISNNSNLVTKIYRKVTSGYKVSYSNTITVFPAGNFAKMIATNSLETTSADLTVYPNPTSESVNFSTNFSTNKEIEIVIYSEKLRDEKSVFRGTVTPNQVVNWNIPSTYQKGLYFYKILSGNKEVKTGKIIVQ